MSGWSGKEHLFMLNKFIIYSFIYNLFIYSTASDVADGSAYLLGSVKAGEKWGTFVKGGNVGNLC